MNVTLRRFFLALFSASFVYAGSAAAQTYPTRPIRAIVPFAPLDRARPLAETPKALFDAARLTVQPYLK